MNKWGAKSQAERSTSDPRLNEIGDEVLKIKNHSVIQGHRGEAAQTVAFNIGSSKLPWPKGKHNGLPSKAQDVRTYPEPPMIVYIKDPDRMSQTELRNEVRKLRKQLKDAPLREEQLYLLGLYKGVGHMMGHSIRTGADWDRDGEIADTKFDDFFHVEIDE